MVKLRQNVAGFAHASREVILPAARQQSVAHIVIPAKVGLAKLSHQRLETDLKMCKSSPGLFRLVQLVLDYMLPESRFRLQPRIVIHLFLPSQAEIGESILSVLCGSYVAYGGLNTEQTGLSETGIARMTHTEWQDVMVDTMPAHRNLLPYLPGNLEDYGQKVQRKLEAAEKELQQKRLRAEREDLLTRLDLAVGRLTERIASMELTAIEADDAQRRLRELVRQQQEQMAETRSWIEAVDELAEGLPEEPLP